MKDVVNIFSFMVAFIAFLLSILALFCKGFCFDASSVVLTLIGSCTTLIVGVSVIDSLTLRRTLRDVDEKMKYLTEKVEKEVEKAEDLEKHVERLKKQCNILFHHTWGLSFCKSDPYQALLEFWTALRKTIEDNDIKRAKSCLTNAEMLLDEIINNNQKNISLEYDALKDIPSKVPQDMTNKDVYIAFKDRIDELLKRIQLIHCNNG